MDVFHFARRPNVLQTLLRWGLSLSLCSGSGIAWSATGHQIGIGGVGGLPHMLGVDLRYLGYSNLEFGLSMGSLPLNTLLKNQIPLEPIAVDLDQPDSYSIIPHISFQMTAFTPYVRYYPWSEHFYTQLSYSIWRFRTNIYGDLQNETTGAVASSVVTGGVEITQTITTPEIGWRFWPMSAVFLDLGLGVSILRKTTPYSYVSSSLSGILSVTPEGQAALDSAQEQVRTQVDSGVASYRQRIHILPSLHLTLGVAL